MRASHIANVTHNTDTHSVIYPLKGKVTSSYFIYNVKD